jgi:hypothetical protein
VMKCPEAFESLHNLCNIFLIFKMISSVKLSVK